MPAMQSVVVRLVVVVAALGIVAWIALSGGDEAAPPTVATPTAKVPDPFAEPARTEPRPSPSKPLPSLALSPEPILPGRPGAAAPVRDPHANASRELQRLPRALVEQKLQEAAEQQVDEEVPTASLDKEDIRDAIQHAKQPITDCYEQALTRDPKLGGRLKVEFTIVTREGVGRLDEASIVDDAEEGAINHPFLAMCALKALADLEFPAPKGEGKVTVRYPFRLEPGEREEADAP